MGFSVIRTLKKKSLITIIIKNQVIYEPEQNKRRWMSGITSLITIQTIAF
jgi:hypothetical protein